MCCKRKIGYKVDSKSIVLPWLVKHAAYVLSRSVKRDDGRSPLAQVGETVDSKILRGEMAKLEPRWTTGTFLGCTDESDEVIVGTAVAVEFARSFRRRTRDKQWQRDALTTFICLPWNPRGLAVEAPMASSTRRYITKSLVQQHGETPGCSACLEVSSQHSTTCRERFKQLINPNATDVMPVIPSAVGGPSPAGDAASTEQRHATQPDTSKHVRKEVQRISKESSHTTSSIIPDPAAARCRNGDGAGAGARRCGGSECVV